MIITEYITETRGRSYTMIAWYGEMWFSQVKSWCHHWKIGENEFVPLPYIVLISSHLYELFSILSAFFFYMNIYSLSPVVSLYLLASPRSSLHSPWRQVEAVREQWKEQTLNPIHSCQNQWFHLTSSRALAKAYLILMDDVYHTIAFQASVHFRLPSDFGKLLKEGFVNIIEAEIFSCAILLTWPTIFFSTTDLKFFPLV